MSMLLRVYLILYTHVLLSNLLNSCTRFACIEREIIGGEPRLE